MILSLSQEGIMANNYITKEIIKTNLPDNTFSGTKYDSLLDSLAERTSRLLDRAAKRPPGFFYVSVDSTRYYNGSGGREQWIDPIAATPTSVEVAETGDLSNYTAWASSDYILWPYNALEDNRPYMRLDLDHLGGTKYLWYSFPKSIKITAKFGWAETLPPEVEEMMIIQAVRWFQRHRQAFRDTVAIPELQQITYVKALDPEVVELFMNSTFSKVVV